MVLNGDVTRYILTVLAHRIWISELLPWDRTSYLTHATCILHRTLREIASQRIQGLLEAYFKINI